MMSDRARLLADDGLRQALLSRTLDEHGGVVAHAAVEERPLDAVGHGCDEPGKLRRDALGHVMHGRIPRQEHVLREAAPEMRRTLGRRVAVADGFGVVAPIRVLAMAILADGAPLALAAHHVMLDEDEIAFPEALAARELAPGLGDVADVLVPHDHGGGGGRRLVQLHVRAADAADLHLQQRRILRDVGHRVLAELGLARRRPHRRQYFFHY
jgi:hypothetical protein